jgi:drug/metabolite transporter (DMT)-like permease
VTGAILGGLGAALAFATATLCSSRSTRMIGEAPVLGWVMVVGLLAVAPFLVLGPGPGPLDRATVSWLVVAGIGNAGGLLLAYRALRFGQVGIVAPIVSTEGAITAVIALLAGESLSVAVWATLAVIVAGIVLSATHEGDPSGPGAVSRADARHAALFAVGAALAFGVSLYGTGRLSGDLPVAWLVLPARLAGVVAVALPLLVAGRLSLTRRAAPLIAAAGLCEVLGFVSFTLGARDGIAVAAVLASQFAAIAAIVAFVLFGERLARVQVAGVAAIVAGVGVLSALQA